VTSLNVAVPPFVRAVDSVVQLQPFDDIKTYLTWDLLRGSVGFLPMPYQDAIYGFFDMTLRGSKEFRPRWKRCVDETDNQLPDALGQTFVQKTLGEAGKRRTQQMVAAIEKEMERDIKSLDWMSPKTKEQAILKLHAVINKIGTK